MRCWLLTLSVLLASCGLRLDSPGSTVHVFAPEDVEAHGTSIPVLYLEEGRALFFPEGVSGATGPVEPRPSELIALGQRKDIVIIAVDAEHRAPLSWIERFLVTQAQSLINGTPHPATELQEATISTSGRSQTRFH